MVPCFGLVTWLAVWSRQRELRTLSTELPVYAAAGWLTPAEPLALASMRARGMARDMARHWNSHPDPARGKAAARAVAEYESFATSLAMLRRRARHDGAGPDFALREQELLHHLWHRREVAAPALTYAAHATGRIRTRLPVPPPIPRQLPYGGLPPRHLPAPHRHYGGHNPYLEDGGRPAPPP